MATTPCKHSKAAQHTLQHKGVTWGRESAADRLGMCYVREACSRTSSFSSVVNASVTPLYLWYCRCTANLALITSNGYVQTTDVPPASNAPKEARPNSHLPLATQRSTCTTGHTCQGPHYHVLCARQLLYSCLAPGLKTHSAELVKGHELNTRVRDDPGEWREAEAAGDTVHKPWGGGGSACAE
jgi:hypothetical protein